MTDQVESGSVVSRQGNDTPNPSEPQNVEPTSPGGSGLDPAVQAYIDDRVTRQWQSGKDRRLDKVEKNEQRLDAVEESIARYESYRAQGKSPEEARREMERDAAVDYYKQQTGQMQPPASPVKGAEASAPTPAEPVDFAGMIEAAGLPVNNDNLNLALRYQGDPKELAFQLNKRKQAQLKTDRPPTGATAAVPTGGGARVVSDLEALQQEYRDKLQKLKPGSSAVRALRTEYRQKGLRV